MEESSLKTDSGPAHKTYYCANIITYSEKS